MLKGKTLEPTPKLEEFWNVDLVDDKISLLQFWDKGLSGFMNNNMVSKDDRVSPKVNGIVVA